MAQLPFVGVRTHKQRVCKLYKEAIRTLESWLHRRHVFRYEATIMRARFDKYKDEKDMMKAVQVIEEGEKELFDYQHYQPKKFPNSPGGPGYDRQVIPPDWILDYWHPLEKAQYPEYFARREQRKKEYVIWWEKEYGKPKPDDSHH